MATSVTITGSGCPIPDADRAGPGAMVRYVDDDGVETVLQFDAGRSTVQRLTAANVWIPNVTAVFLTHYHSDHVSGLADLVLTHWTMDRTDKAPGLPIIAPQGSTSNYVASMLDGWTDDIEVRAAHANRSSRPHVELVSFAAPPEPVEVWRRGDVVVSACQVRHEPVVDAVGYRIDTPDGSVAISGDTRVCAEVAALADGVDVLVYEAMRFSFYDDLPEHRHYVMDYHADTKLIGAQAAELNVPKLVLTHMIPPPANDAERQLYIDEIRSGGYQGDVVVADDMHTTAVGAAGLPQVKEFVPVAERD